MGNCVYNIYNAYITPMWGCTGMIRSRFHSVAHNLSLIARPSASRCGQRCHWDGRKSSWENSFLAEKKADTFRLEEDFGTFPSLFFFVGSRFFFWGVGGGEKGRFWRETYFTIWLVIFLVSSVSRNPPGRFTPFGRKALESPTDRTRPFWVRTIRVVETNHVVETGRCLWHWRSLQSHRLSSVLMDQTCWLTYWTCVVYDVIQDFFSKGNGFQKKWREDFGNGELLWKSLPRYFWPT